MSDESDALDTSRPKACKLLAGQRGGRYCPVQGQRAARGKARQATAQIKQKPIQENQVPA